VNGTLGRTRCGTAGMPASDVAVEPRRFEVPLYVGTCRPSTTKL